MHAVCSYAPPTHCPVLTYPVPLYQATGEKSAGSTPLSRYARATRCPVPTYAAPLSCYAASSNARRKGGERRGNWNARGSMRGPHHGTDRSAYKSATALRRTKRRTKRDFGGVSCGAGACRSRTRQRRKRCPLSSYGCDMRCP
eukprot:2730949-Rhodomonas_salina.1